LRPQLGPGEGLRPQLGPGEAVADHVGNDQGACVSKRTRFARTGNFILATKAETDQTN